MGTYLLIPDDYQRGMKRQMELRTEAANAEQLEEARRLHQEHGIITAYQSPPPAREYAAAIGQAATIRLPELHTFVDAGSRTQVDVCG